MTRDNITSSCSLDVLKEVVFIL